MQNCGGSTKKNNPKNSYAGRRIFFLARSSQYMHDMKRMSRGLLTKISWIAHGCVNDWDWKGQWLLAKRGDGNVTCSISHFF